MLTVLLLVSFAANSKTEWIQPSDPLLFRADYSLSVGFYNGSIYLLGGDNHGYQLTEYVLAHNLFIDHGLEALNTDSIYGVYGFSNYWTQIDHLLYVAEHYDLEIGNKVSIFNMKTKTFTSSEIGYIPIGADTNMCITSNSTHIFILGGDTHDSDASTLSLVQIYDLSTNEWITSAPSMNTARADFACIIHPNNGKLYAIGGVIDRIRRPAEYLSSIEVIQSFNISHKTWTYINGSLSKALAWNLCAVYKHNIYVIGGADSDFATKTVHVINVLTDAVTLLPDLMPTALCVVAPIVVNHTLYVFGGEDNIGAVDTWMMYDLLRSSNPITTQATVFPSINMSDAISTHWISNTEQTIVATDDILTINIEPEHESSPIKNLMIILAVIIVCVVILAIGFVYKTNAKSKDDQKQMRDLQTADTGTINTQYQTSENRKQIKVRDLLPSLDTSTILKENKNVEGEGSNPNHNEMHVEYNMNAENDEIVFGDDEITAGDEITGQTNYNINENDDVLVVGDDELISGPMTAEGMKTEQCIDCGQVKEGKIYDGDGLFYCVECFDYYANYADGPNGNTIM